MCVFKCSPGAQHHSASFELIIVDPVVRTECARGSVQDLCHQVLGPKRHRVVVHEPGHQQARTSVEEELRGELATEVVHLEETWRSLAQLIKVHLDGLPQHSSVRLARTISPGFSQLLQ